MGDKGKIKYSEVEFRDHKWVEGSELVKYLVFPNQYDNHRVAMRKYCKKRFKIEFPGINIAFKKLFHKSTCACPSKMLSSSSIDTNFLNL
jgi:hypothetical protein